MKPMITYIAVAVAVSLLANVSISVPTDGEQHKPDKDGDQSKHLAAVGELQKQAKGAKEIRPAVPPPPEPLTRQQKAHYERLGRDWVRRLWLTNDCFVAKNPFRSYEPVWTHHFGVWTNEFTRHVIGVSRKPTSATIPWIRIELRFCFEVSSRLLKCNFDFWGDGSDNVLSVRNDAYNYPNVFYSTADHKPIHTNEREARLKAAEYAATFGVFNLWDEGKFELRSIGFFHGVWQFALTPLVNGYPALFPLSIHIADLPGYPLGEWYSSLYQIPTNLPTRVVLTAEDGKEKGVEYLNKYFPLKNLVPKLTFHSNRLEYMRPNYNYIRPADESGFSDYEPAHDEDTLIWNNTFKKPEGTGFPWVNIYVDAATGEMLGGSD